MHHPRFSAMRRLPPWPGLYEQGIRAKVETEANIGKVIVIDVNRCLRDR